MPANCRVSNLCAVMLAIAMVCTASAVHMRADPPPLDDAIGAWLSARAWVDAMEVPDGPRAPSAVAAPAAPSEPGAPAVPGATAIVIRLNGRVVGTGVDDGPPAGQLARAVARALELVGRDDAIHLIPREERSGFGKRLSIELEIAAAPVPIASRSVGQIISRFEPGLEAISVRRGDRWAWSMPSVLQASNLLADPVRVCVALLQELAVDPTDLPTQELPESMSFYRASTRRLVQRTPTESPFEVLRGHEIIPLGALARPGRAEFAHAVARHLETHIVRPSKDAPPETAALKPLGMRGDYRPHLDLNRVLAAPPQDQALSAFALAVFANSELAAPEARARATTAAGELLVALEEIAEIEEDPMSSPAAIAFAILAISEIDRGQLDAARPSTPFVDGLRRALAEQLTKTAPLDHNRSVALAAGAALEARGTPVIDKAMLTQRLDEAWQSPSIASFIGTMPWLMMAERSRGSFSDPARAARLFSAIEPFRRALLASQLGVGGPEESAPDAAGGFALTHSQGTNATAQSARPTIALAIMLSEPLLTPDEFLQDAMRSQLMALRFLRQLAVDDRSIYAFRDRARTIGGIRESLWDNTQPVAASAVTLLAVVESEHAMQAAAARSRSQSGNPGNRPEGSTGVSP